MTAFADGYVRQVALLVEVLPLVDNEEIFALKGGTAINLFDRPLPRLSVDIDLVYLPSGGYDEARAAITASLQRIASSAETVGLQPVLSSPTQLRLLAPQRAQVVVEVTPVLRGTVFPTERRAVVQEVEDRFGYAEIAVVSRADLYAGKIVAALDRQHPRDLFDVHHLLCTDGLGRDLVRAVVVYLCSHNRTIHELLAPNRKDLRQEFEQAFVGMTAEPVALETLLDARERLINELGAALTDGDREFLLSFKRGSPRWDMLGLPHVTELPAIRWKQQNLVALAARDAKKHAELCGNLDRVLAR